MKAHLCTSMSESETTSDKKEPIRKVKWRWEKVALDYNLGIDTFFLLQNKNVLTYCFSFNIYIIEFM